MASDVPRYRRDPRIIAAEVDGSLVLLTVEMEYVELDATGALLWEALAEPSTPGALADRLTQHFDVGLDEALGDVERFLGQLRALDLITVEPAAE